MKIAVLVIASLAAAAVFIPFYLTWLNMLPSREPSAGTTPRPEDLGMTAETLYLVTTDGVHIRAWLITGETGAPCVILVHGKGGAKNGLLHLARPLRDAGYHVLIPDLRGHGESADAKVTFGLREKLDLQIALDALKRRPGVDTTRIGVYAQSMGSAAAIQGLAADPSVRGLLLDSSFDRLDLLLVDLGASYYNLPRPFGLLGKYAFRLLTGSPAAAVDNAAVLAARPVPCVFFHVAHDATIPIARGRALHAAASGPKLFFETDGDGHAGSWGDDPKHFEAVMIAFFREVFRGDTPDLSAVEAAHNS